MQTSRPQSTSTHNNAPSPLPRSINTQTKVLDTSHGRILCIADIRGRLSALNDLAREQNAQAILHTGDFGFFEDNSLERINDRTLRHLTTYSPLIPNAQRSHLLAPENPPSVIRSTVTVSLLSEFPLLLSGQIKLKIPVYTVWGACEDVAVLEKFRAGAYNIENLHVLDEATTRVIDVAGIKLRLFGLGGALVPHKMFDNGDGQATIAGGQGTMWTTVLQIGELVDTAQRVYDSTETRLLLSHASPGREGIIAQLALALKIDLTVSAGLHFRYATSYNDFSVQPDFDGFRHRLTTGREAFDKVWDSVKHQVNEVVDEGQSVLLDKALHVFDKLQGAGPFQEDPAWKNCWNWNLCDAAYGYLIFDIRDGRVSSELKSQGFNYAYRRSSTAATPGATASPLAKGSPLPEKVSTPIAAAAKPLPASVVSSPPPRPVSSQQPNPAPLIAAATSAPGTPSQPAEAEAPSPTNSDAPKQNGTENGGTGPSGKGEKNKKTKDKTKDKRDQRKGGAETGDKDKPTPWEVTITDTSTLTSSAANLSEDVKSPIGTASSLTDGTRTPTGRTPRQRNPWTLWMRLTVGMMENEVREFFGEAAGGIVRINYANNAQGKNQMSIYVEFGDEESMRAALEKKAEKFKDTVPDVMQATDRESRDHSSSGRGSGRGRGRGGRGGGDGGFAARGFAAAGLVNSKRGGGPRSTGGGAPNPPAESS